MGCEWREVTIEEVATIKHGFAFKGEYFTDVPQPSVLLTPGNFAIGGGFQTGKPKYYCGPIPIDYVLAEGDLVVTMTDLSKASDTLGYAARVPKTAGTTYLHNQRIGLVQVKDSQAVRAEWLHYLMRTQPYRSWVIGSASGTTVKHTSPSRIGAYAFTLPPIAEQLSAAQTLDTIESRIDLLRQTNTTLEAIAQALFKSWFVDFDPVHAKAEGREPEAMDAATAALFPSEFEESELGPIPKGWRVQRLGNVCSLTWGNTSMTKKSYVEDGFKAFSAAGQDGLVEVAERSGIGSVISAIGTVGVVHLAFGQWTAIKNTLTAQCENDTNSAWLHYLLKTVRFPARGSTQQFISQTDARGVRVIAPPDVRQEYGAICVALISKMEALQDQVRSLTLLRDTLLPRLISGKLRLPEATEAAEAALA